MNELYVDSIIKHFGTKQILTDIFISCKPGDIIGLFGRNGTGKSTLLKIISGTLNAERKFVKIDGLVINSLFERRNLVSYLPQDNFLPNHMKIKNIISLFCNNSDKKKLKVNPFIKPYLNYKSKELSGGERRLIEIFLVVAKAKYVLIDEPFNGVAPLYKNDIKNLIYEASKEKKGFIITDHDYTNVIDITTKNMLLFDGGIKEVKTVEDLKYWGYVPNSK